MQSFVVEIGAEIRCGQQKPSYPPENVLSAACDCKGVAVGAYRCIVEWLLGDGNDQCHFYEGKYQCFSSNGDKIDENRHCQE